ncbi:MAG: hypothetical protein DRO92_04685 [Candidatus Altiarchaeales archaeon]|nr:MAG: hypothetical protein DRO92_04685 [Candidatus Altiarchaeales archaeon]
MTRANISINGEEFHVLHDGDLVDEIAETLRLLIEQAREKLKNIEDIPDYVISQLYRETSYRWIYPGFISLPNRTWVFKIEGDKLIFDAKNSDELDEEQKERLQAFVDEFIEEREPEGGRDL